MKTIYYPNKILFGHKRIIYFKTNFKVEICSALWIFDSHPTPHSPANTANTANTAPL